MPSGITTAETLDYISSALSLAILLLRLSLELRRQREFDLNFYLASASIASVVGRLVATHYYIKFGAVGETPAGSGSEHVDPDEAKVGEILVLVARILFTATLWLQICLILSFYARLVHGVTMVTWALRIVWIAVVSTFIAVVLATFLECRPFELYWKKAPEVDYCTRAYAQLLLQTCSNSVLDVVVLIIAYPLTRLPKHSWSTRARLYVLVGMGLMCIGITIARAVQIFQQPNQNIRSIWASVQIAVAIFVGNAPSIYGSLKLLKRARTTSDHDRSFGIAESNDSNRPPPLVGLHSVLGNTDADTTPTSTS
ncbi:uncharacterized protein PG998_004937 [Apiospora kogelbergensis]|uniref:uncharacterized protein n=1 Tax=Apiospora kogelbergensis TaxID=1337665 RepID=UPI0031325395